MYTHYGTVLWHSALEALFLLVTKINQNRLNEIVCCFIFFKLFTFNAEHSDPCITPMWKRVFKQYSIQCPFTSSFIFKGQLKMCDIPLTGFFGGVGVT